jgi:hypothetical protein
MLAAPELLDIEVLQALRRLDGMGAIPPGRGDLPETLAALRIRRYRYASLVTGIWSLRNNLTAYDAACVNARAPAERHPRDPRRAAGKRSRVGGFGHRALTGLCESPLTPPPGAAKSRHNLMG